MSVINNVLKDLESRESRFTPIGVSAAETPTARQSDRRPLYAPLLLLPLGAIGWFLFESNGAMPVLTGPTPAAIQASPETRPEPIAAVQVAAAEPAATPVPAKAAAPVKEPEPVLATVPNQIIGLQIREAENEMRLEFALREKVVAFLQERTENSFGYHLRDIDSRISAPRMRDNPWVRALDIVPREQGVDVKFVTAPDMLVETRQTSADGEPVWYISLRKAQPPVVNTALAPPPRAAAETMAASAAEVVETPPAGVEQAPAVVATAPAPAEVRVEIRPTDPDAPSADRLEYAVELIGSRRFADAENLLLQLLDGAEDHAARQRLLALYQHQRRQDRFVRLARESMRQYPDDALFRSEYARQRFQNGAYREVIELFDGREGLDANQQALVAASYQRLDRHDQAVRHYRLALALDAGNAKNWIGLGISQEQMAKLEDALNSYRKAGQLGQLDSRLQAFVEKRSDTLAQVLN